LLTPSARMVRVTGAASPPPGTHQPATVGGRQKRPSRRTMPKVPKNRAKAESVVDRSRKYSVEEACSLVKQAKFAKFDETVDLAVRLGVNPKHADQMVRGAIVLPHGTG